jgi:DNA-binding CsgD family transcriptional regulator
MIEAAYRCDETDEGWLRGLLDAAAPLDAGCGTYARIDDVSNPDRPRISAYALSRLPEKLVATVDEGHARAPVGINRALYARSPPVRFARDQLKGLPDPLRESFAGILAAYGFEDVMGVFARDSDGLLTHIGIPMAKRCRIHPRTVHRLTCVAAHLTSAARLRRAGAPAPDAPGTDAVLDSSGALRHAAAGARSRDVRARLSEAVKQLERARGPLSRSDPDASLAVWRGLVDGKWSLVDHWDSDGRRFILARRNTPRIRDPRALTEAEGAVVEFLAMGHPQKYVSYLLGLTPSTVASQFASARRKLGVRSQQEVIALFSARHRQSPEPAAVAHP